MKPVVVETNWTVLHGKRYYEKTILERPAMRHELNSPAAIPCGGEAQAHATVANHEFAAVGNRLRRRVARVEAGRQAASRNPKREAGRQISNEE
jgi:hypothetical protein